MRRPGQPTSDRSGCGAADHRADINGDLPRIAAAPELRQPARRIFAHHRPPASAELHVSEVCPAPPKEGAQRRSAQAPEPPSCWILQGRTSPAPPGGLVTGPSRMNMAKKTQRQDQERHRDHRRACRTIDREGRGRLRRRRDPPAPRWPAAAWIGGCARRIRAARSGVAAGSCGPRGQRSRDDLVSDPEGAPPVLGVRLTDAKLGWTHRPASRTRRASRHTSWHAPPCAVSRGPAS